MPATELVTAVAVDGEVLGRWCDGCQSSAGFSARLWAMLPSGLRELGTIVGCDYCDPDAETIVCAFCPTSVNGGTAFHRHMLEPR